MVHDMNAFEFMGSHPLLTFSLAVVVGYVLGWPFRLVMYWIRHRNIVAQGWPPIHLDADGDHKSNVNVE